MKKSILSIVLLLSAMMMTATPNVTITIDNVGRTTFTCSFAKNDDCSSYYILAAQPSDMQQYVSATNPIEKLVEMWGIKYTEDSTYTWTGMNPNTLYVVYVTAKDAAGTRYLFTDTLTTQQGGGHGESVITISVTDITDVTAKTTATPNDQTMLFKDMIIAQFLRDSIYSYYHAIDSLTADSMTNDSILNMLKVYPYVQYDEDVWVWSSLTPSTDYIFVAAGMNADSIWGDVVYAPFKTLGSASAVENVEMNTVTVYPNPATDYIIVNGVEAGETIQVIDLRGNVLVETTDAHISVADFVPGVYMVRTAAGVNKFIVR